MTKIEKFGGNQIYKLLFLLFLVLFTIQHMNNIVIAHFILFAYLVLTNVIMYFYNIINYNNFKIFNLQSFNKIKLQILK